MFKKKKKFKGRPKKYFLISLSPPQKSCFSKKSHIFLCLSDSEKKYLKNLKLCLYSEILLKIQVGGLKKFLPPWKFFFFHVWDIQDTFYMCKKKKKLKGGQKKFFLTPLPPTKKSLLQKKVTIFYVNKILKKKI